MLADIRKHLAASGLGLNVKLILFAQGAPQA